MLPRTRLTEMVGLVLCRLVVPLWILAGVVFKLYSNTPSTLPGIITQTARDMGIGLGNLLYTLIGLEIFAIGVMVLIARFARPMAIFMLTGFCLILIGEMIRGADSCGCFGGAVTIKPWQMFIADATLLIAVALFPVSRPGADAQSDEPSPAPSLAGTAAVAVMLLVVGIGASFTLGRVMHPEQVQQVLDDDDPDELPGEQSGDDEEDRAETSEAADTNERARAQRTPTRNPSPLSMPSFWYAEDTSAWIGKPWREVDLFQFMPRWPRDMDEGTRYVVFYNRTCEHCWEMFENDLTRDLGAPVVAIEVPHSRTTLTSPDAWPMVPEEELVAVDQLMNLPLGPDWIIQSPMAIRIEDGRIVCAMEGDHKTCFELE